MLTLKYQVEGNAKLDIYGKKLAMFSLPSGYSCPAALDCLSKAHRVTGKITDGLETLFRCFSATSEALSPNARRARWHNFDILRSLDFEDMVLAIHDAYPEGCDLCRVHVSGDFYNQRYFDAWMQVARLMPDKLFYAYTKSLTYWVSRLNDIPPNFNLTASYGGRHDHLIATHNLKYSKVVFHPSEAAQLGLEIDHDDSLAMHGTKPFALLIHGTQPKGSDASVATKRLKAEGIKFAYSKKYQAVKVSREELAVFRAQLHSNHV